MATLAATATSTCPRCNGRLLAQRDPVSDYLNCLMCGYVRERRQLDPATARAEAELDGREEPRTRTQALQAAAEWFRTTR